MMYKTFNALETQKIAGQFAKKLKGGDIVCFYGDLGFGKTTFIQGLARGLGIKKRIISPTFVIIRTYEISSNKNFYHVDLYRLKGEQDIEATGLLEIMKDSHSIVVIEWPEKLGKFIPKNRWEIKFDLINDNERNISIEKIDHE